MFRPLKFTFTPQQSRPSQTKPFTSLTKMQQRFWTYSSRPHEEHAVTIGSVAQPPQVMKHDSPRTRVDDTDGLPVYDLRSGVGKKEASRPVEKWVHVIPVLVLFCLFVLWWFSFSVKVVSIDGRIAAIRETDIPLPLNDSRIIAILAATAISPFASVPQNPTVNNLTVVQLVSKGD